MNVAAYFFYFHILPECQELIQRNLKDLFDIILFLLINLL